MRKKDKLYTVNKWNRPAFMPDENRFDEGGPFSKENISASFGKEAIGKIGKGLTGMGLGVIGGIGNKLAYNALSGGMSSGAGKAISGIGNTIGGAISNIPGIGTLAGPAVQIATGLIGGGVNRLFGSKVDAVRLAAANKDINSLNSFTSSASSFDDIKGPTAIGSVAGIYQGGALNTSAKKDQATLEKRITDALAFADRSIDNNAGNLAGDQLNNNLANYSSYGGFLDMMDNNMGAIEYDFLADYLLNKKKQAEGKDKVNSDIPANAFGFGGCVPSRFAFGGDLQTNISDFSTGLTHIDAGGSHEQNPNDGVQLGVDQDGTPNLVEEGEVIFNDYVYSNRINVADQDLKSRYHVGRKKDITYADLAKKIEKEASERPNDVISQNGLKAAMAELAEAQEAQKQEMEAARAREAFEALSPEEQTAIMQQKAAEEQAAQQQAMQQGAMVQEGISPEEVAMAQAQQADGSEAMIGQEPQMNAEGGKLFAGGGQKNSGKWKDDKENHWDVYTKPGLRAFIDSYRERLKKEDSDEQKAAIRNEMVEEFNTIQKGYKDIYQNSASGNFQYDEGVMSHQKNFDKAKGNTGFYSTDEQGNTKNLIADAIDMPKGHATDDKPDNWYDGYWGPRTSIRNFGSTEYGDDKYYKDLVDEFKELGVHYAPNDEWKYGESTLYGLSIPKAEAKPEEKPDWTPDWQGAKTETPAATTPAKSAAPAEGDDEGVNPRHRAEWPRYAGLFGPAVGLGMQMAGIGKPDKSGIDAAIASASTPAHLADYQPIGNYLTYRPLDIWFEQNRMNANARATDRALMNTSGGNSAVARAGLLASGYNNLIADGQLFRSAQEYNDNLRKSVEEFNRGTDQFNAEAYNRNSQFNADAKNRAKQYSAQLAMEGATQKANMDAGWYNGIYGNIAGLFQGISDLGRENAEFNMISKGAADGVYGNLGKSNTGKTYIKSKGGKIRKRRGLTF